MVHIKKNLKQTNKQPNIMDWVGKVLNPTFIVLS